MAILPSRNQCFVCAEHLVVLNLGNGELIQTIEINNAPIPDRIEFIDSDCMILLQNGRPSIYKKKEQTWQKMTDLQTHKNTNAEMSMMYFDSVSRIVLTTSHLNLEISVFDEHGQLLKSIEVKSITSNSWNIRGMCVNHLTGELLLCIGNFVISLK